MTPQEKIDKIYEILLMQERREYRRMIFAWVYRWIIFAFTILIIFFPGLFFEKISDLMKPMIQSMAEEMIQKQKENISNISENAFEKLKNFTQ